MKKIYIILIIVLIGLVFTIVITPVEARLTSQELNWTYILNLKEYLFFAFSFMFGILIGKKLYFKNENKQKPTN